MTTLAASNNAKPERKIIMTSSKYSLDGTSNGSICSLLIIHVERCSFLIGVVLLLLLIIIIIIVA